MQPLDGDGSNTSAQMQDDPRLLHLSTQIHLHARTYVPIYLRGFIFVHGKEGRKRPKNLYSPHPAWFKPPARKEEQRHASRSGRQLSLTMPQGSAGTLLKLLSRLAPIPCRDDLAVAAERHFHSLGRAGEVGVLTGHFAAHNLQHWSGEYAQPTRLPPFCFYPRLCSRPCSRLVPDRR